MTYSEFKSELKKAKLSIKTFAELLEMNPTSITNYKRTGGVPRHLEVAIVLLAKLAELGVLHHEVFNQSFKNASSPQ